MPDVSTLTLNNGVDMPALGLGVFQTPPDETVIIHLAFYAGWPRAMSAIQVAKAAFAE